MSGQPIAGSGDAVFEIRTPGFDVSWAGPSAQGNFCLGSDTGKVMEVDSDGVKRSEIAAPFGNGEAVNGVAFSGKDWMAVSSRNSLSLCELPVGGTGQFFSSLVSMGTHGVLASGDGCFYAPLGLNGILRWLPSREPPQSVNVSNSDIPHYIYRLANVRSDSGEEYLACAMRRSGVGRLQVGLAKRQPLMASAPGGLDVIDVCPIHHSGLSGLAGLGRDGTIILYRDVLQSLDPVTLKLPEVTGDAYRVLSARGILFVLTSHALYVLAEVIDEVLVHDRQTVVLKGLTLPMEAVDANLIGDRWLLVVLTDRVVRFDLDVLLANPGHNGKSTTPLSKSMAVNRTTPRWKTHEVEQRMSAAVPV